MMDSDETDLQLLAAIVRDSDDAIFSKTPEGIITSWNGAAECIYGYTAAEAIGCSVAMLVPVDREDELPKIMQRLREGAGINHYDTLRVTKDGRLVNISLTISPIRNPAGDIIGAASIGRDVTSEKEAEAALRESARAYKLLMEQASDAILVSYPDQPLIEVNQRASEMFGYTREELLQLTTMDSTLPESVGALPPRLDEILARQSTDAQPAAPVAEGTALPAPPRAVAFIERPVRRKDGTVIVTELSTRQMDDGRIITIARDITDRKRAEQALRESEARYRAIVEDQTELIARFRRDGTLTFVNAAFCRYWDQPSETLLGGSVFPFLPASGQQQVEQYIADRRPAPAQSNNEQPVLRPDGTLKWLLWTMRPLFDEAGTFIEFQVVGLDITEHKRAEEERIAKESAQATNLAKSTFLSGMSHELRTPLTAILGFGELLQLDNPTPTQQESIEYILEAGEHLLTLVSEVLDIARIEAGQLNLAMEPVLLHQELQKSLDLVRPLAAQWQIAVQADLVGLEDRRVLADHQRLQQVLLNLLGNAIKYNRMGGGVQVTCHELQAAATGLEPQAPPSPTRLRIAVHDTGPGLAPDQMARLFTPFERLGVEQGGSRARGWGWPSPGTS